MASHASALKAHRQGVKRREQNRQFRSELRTALKAIRTAITAKDAETAKGQFSKTVSLIDRMARKGVIHDTAAARYTSRIHTQLSRLTTPA